MNAFLRADDEGRPLLRAAGTGGDLTADAWISTIAIAHGASVLPLDSDFARFANLRWESPLHPVAGRG